MDKFDAIVIGSGALGSSTAFHLAKAGRDVAVLDQAEIASQTSARAAGLSGQVRSTEVMTRLAVRAVEKIERLAEDTGEPIEFFQPGSMSVARRPEHLKLLAERVAAAKKLGLEVDMITAEEACERNPFLQNKGIVGSTLMRRDVFLEPVQVPRAYAKGAVRLGATMVPHTKVSELVVEHGAVTRVVTDRGEFSAPVIVDAAGGWLRFVASLAGTKVPAVAMRHQLMITNPLPGVSNQQPITRIIDANVYVRPDRGGLMFGGYESDPMPVDLSKLPGSFRIENLELDLAVLKRLAGLVKDQFPIFQTELSLREHRGGLPTMTMDGHHIIGQAPGVRNLYVIGGCNVGGLSTAPALSEQLVELIVNGRTTYDLSLMSPARFAEDLSEAELQEKCRDRYVHYYIYASPTSARPAA
ncbi:NAD(P)/FAD-dependent oxidoreductase [Bradyrhizobium sp. UFLA05-112]